MASPSSYVATAPSPSTVLAHLAAAKVSILLGLSDPELAYMTSNFLPTSNSARGAVLAVAVAGKLARARGIWRWWLASTSR
uniref:Uncharacterized protein n=1 Tax=Oryza glaberrima TaxID=4538 RepID=I1QJ81_ORYGL